VKKGLNFVGFKDAEADRVLMDGRQTFDEAKRKQCYDRFQEILADQQPYIFLYVPYSLPAVSSRIKGIVPAPAGITYNIEKWFVPKALQKYTALQ
jgi:peptide/nickel transport system substrate-binding protein